jgi:hypothetical protein
MGDASAVIMNWIFEGNRVARRPDSLEEGEEGWNILWGARGYGHRPLHVAVSVTQVGSFDQTLVLNQV